MLAGMGDGIESDPSCLTISCSTDKHDMTAKSSYSVPVGDTRC